MQGLGMSATHLWRDDLDGCHESVSDDGHSQKHVHERDEIHDGPDDLLSETGIDRLPYGQDDSRPALHRFAAWFVQSGAVAVVGQVTVELWGNLWSDGGLERRLFTLGFRRTGWGQRKDEGETQKEDRRASRGKRCHGLTPQGLPEFRGGEEIKEVIQHGEEPAHQGTWGKKSKEKNFNGKKSNRKCICKCHHQKNKSHAALEEQHSQSNINISRLQLCTELLSLSFIEE